MRITPAKVAILHEMRPLHKGESLCCFQDSASVTYGGMLPSDLTLSALRFILSAKSRQSCLQDCETVDFCNNLEMRLLMTSGERLPQARYDLIEWTLLLCAEGHILDRDLALAQLLTASDDDVSTASVVGIGELLLHLVR